MLLVNNIISLFLWVIITIIARTAIVCGWNVETRTTQSLATLAQAQRGIELCVRLDAGSSSTTKQDHKETPHLFLDRFRFHLREEPVTTGNNHHAWLSAGRNFLSSGLRCIEIVEHPSFVNMHGKQIVPFEDGSWEMIWRNDSITGSIMCSFNVPKKATRNDATFPSGRMYLSFVIWNKNDLTQKQTQKFQIQQDCKEYLREQNEALRKCLEETDVVLKGMHFEKAAEASEKYSLSGIAKYQNIPNNDETIAIEEDLLLTRTGTILTKGFFLEREKIIGNAVIRSPYPLLSSNPNPHVDNKTNFDL